MAHADNTTRLQELRCLSLAGYAGAGASKQVVANLEMTIGMEVRSCRRQRGITLVELAQAAGLSLGMMSKIENGAISASLSTLQALSHALCVPLTALFRRFDADRHEPLFTKAGATRPGRFGGGTQVVLAGAVSTSFDTMAMPCLVTITRQDEISLQRHSGMKLVYLLEGEFGYRHGLRLFRMTPGDSLLFNAEVIHGPCRLDRLPVRFLSAQSTPANGDVSSITPKSQSLTDHAAP